MRWRLVRLPCRSYVGRLISNDAFDAETPARPAPRGRVTRVLRAYAPAAVWALIVLYAGGLSGVDLDPWSLDLGVPPDKLAHFLMYAILGGLVGWGWRRSGKRIPRIWPIAAVLLLAACDEWRQRALPTRSSDPTDWVADATGALIVFGLVTLTTRRQKDEGES